MDLPSLMLTMNRWVFLCPMMPFIIMWSDPVQAIPCSGALAQLLERAAQVQNLSASSDGVAKWGQDFTRVLGSDCGQGIEAWNAVREFRASPEVKNALRLVREGTQRAKGATEKPRPGFVVLTNDERIQRSRDYALLAIAIALQDCRGVIDACSTEAAHDAFAAIRQYMQSVTQATGDQHIAEFAKAISFVGSPLAGVPPSELAWLHSAARDLIVLQPRDHPHVALPADLDAILKRPLDDPMRGKLLVEYLAGVAKTGEQRGGIDAITSLAHSEREMLEVFGKNYARSIVVDVDGLAVRDGSCPLRERVRQAALTRLTAHSDFSQLGGVRKRPAASGGGALLRFDVAACSRGAGDCLRLTLVLGSAASQGSMVAESTLTEPCPTARVTEDLVESAFASLADALRMRVVATWSEQLPPETKISRESFRQLPRELFMKPIQLSKSSPKEYAFGEHLKMSVRNLGYAGIPWVTDQDQNGARLDWKLEQDTRLIVTLSAGSAPLYRLTFDGPGVGAVPGAAAQTTSAFLVSYYEAGRVPEPPQPKVRTPSALCLDCGHEKSKAAPPWYHGLYLPGGRQLEYSNWRQGWGWVILESGLVVASVALSLLAVSERNQATRFDDNLSTIHLYQGLSYAAIGAVLPLRFVASWTFSEESP